MKNESRNRKLEELLISISKDILLKNCESYVEDFKAIYSDGFRHEYSTITRVLMSINDVQDRDYLPEKIKKINENIEDTNTHEKVSKLWDHVNLENIRLRELINISENVQVALEAAKNINEQVEASKKEINEINTDIKNARDDLLNTQSNLKKAEKKLKKVQKTMKDSTTQSITILSIFAGVVMAFTGGMSYISQALASLNQIGPYRAGAFILLIGVIMFNVIFLLLYMIGKLTGRYIGSNGKCNNPEKTCKHKSITCCINRYPYIISFNFISIVILWTILIINFINKFKVFEIIFNDITYEMISNMLGLYLLLILGVIISYSPFMIILYKILTTKCKCDSKGNQDQT